MRKIIMVEKIFLSMITSHTKILNNSISSTTDGIHTIERLIDVVFDNNNIKNSIEYNPLFSDFKNENITLDVESPAINSLEFQLRTAIFKIILIKLNRKIEI